MARHGRHHNNLTPFFFCWIFSMVFVESYARTQMPHVRGARMCAYGPYGHDKERIYEKEEDGQYFRTL